MTVGVLLTQVSKHDIDSIIGLHKSIVSNIRSIGIVYATGAEIGLPTETIQNLTRTVSAEESQLETLLYSLKDLCND